ncbi:hypothetical protein BSZ36_11870 [Rubricoccus marinus]|uniref:Peptidase S8/S53 domain-containing protein n=1 Tax=Rubricoccus marinus TaxID=716817 RepID=A0A259U102_9BACT|nr:hypothetical protein BSZ36_11870 [Rubricoccus marinus]
MALWCALFCLCGLASAADAQTPDPAVARASPEVAAALGASGEARVMVMLDSPGYKQADPSDLAAVKREVAVLQRAVLGALGASGYTAHHQYETVPALALTLTSPEALAALAAHPSVLRIDLDVGGSGGLAESVARIRANERHAEGNAGSGVTVAVLDSGIDTDHPDFAGRVVDEACFLGYGASDGSGQCPDGRSRQRGAGSGEDDNGHGTHVAGIVASGGAVSAPGVAPGADLVIVKVLNGDNGFRFFSEIVAGLDYVSANPQLGVRLINMSLLTDAQFAGECDNATSYTMAGASVVNRLRERGVLAFASAGNNGSGTTMGAPACIRNVISVGATDDQDNVTGFSQSNATTDVFAPGDAIVSSYLNGGTTAISGTSMASPHAAGCAALLLESGDAVTPDDIEAFLESSRVRVTDGTNGLSFPRLDCAPAGLVASLSGAAGYRSLALPTGSTYDELLGRFWTQGFPGSDAPEAACSAYTFGEASGAVASGYACLPGQNAAFTRGRGVVAYIYADDDQNASGVQGGFPKLLSVSEPGAGAPFSAFPLSYGGQAGAPAHERGWNLLGNPLGEAVDWNRTVRTGLSPTVYVLDPNYHGGDWRTWTAGVGGDLPGGILPPFQGFFARAVAPAPALEVPLAAVVTGPRVYGATASGEPLPLRFEVRRGSEALTSAFVAVAPEAALGLDAADAPRLRPLAWPQVVLSTRAPGGALPLSLNALPPEAQGEIELPLEVAAKGFARVDLALTLAWSGALPEGWGAVLVDRQASTTTPLGSPGTYAFTLPPVELALKRAEAALGLDGGLQREETPATEPATTTGARFVLRVTPAPSTGTPQPAGASGAEIGLTRPNPASQRSAVRISLAYPERVRVSVFDALGREVVVAHDGELAPEATVALDLAPLAAGVYAVRIVGETFQAVRSLTVVR